MHFRKRHRPWDETNCKIYFFTLSNVSRALHLGSAGVENGLETYREFRILLRPWFTINNLLILLQLFCNIARSLLLTHNV